jgi:hypothetical protein
MADDDLLPNNPRRDLKRLQEMFCVYRDYIKFEHELQNHRSTWHLLMQGFLFATLGVIGEWQIGKEMPTHLVTEREWLPYILMSAGSLIAIAAFISIWASDMAIRSLVKRWHKQSGAEFDSDFIARVPDIKGGGSTWAERMGKVASMFIPVIALLAWIVVAIMYQLDVSKDKSPIPADAAQIPTRFAFVSTKTHSDIALDTSTGMYCKTWDWQPPPKSKDKNLIYDLQTCKELLREPLKDKR